MSGSNNDNNNNTAVTLLPAWGRKIIDTEPCTRVIKYHHIGLAVTDMAASQLFYATLGFTDSAADNSSSSNTTTTSNNSVILKHHSTGMELHLLQADDNTEPTTTTSDDGNNDNKIENILMDRPTEKYCGHTHVCFGVPSVQEARRYFEGPSCGWTISGERTMGGVLRAIFVRDPDRTVLEFERQAGGEGEAVEEGCFDSSMIGTAGHPIDHLGTRVSDPPRSWQWYARTLGFVQDVMRYDHDPDDPLKNFRPWISRTEATTTTATMDMNLIINANMPSSETTNILFAGGGGGGFLRPGVVYAGLEVTDLAATTAALQSAGVSVYTDEQLSSVLGLKRDKIPRFTTTTTTTACDGDSTTSTSDSSSMFITDPDGNLYRLVQLLR